MSGGLISSMIQYHTRYQAGCSTRAWWNTRVGTQSSLRIFPLEIKAVARRCSVKKVFLKILQNSQENTCARASFLIKLQAYVIKKETLPQCFPVNFAQFLRTPFLTGHLRWLLLQKYIFGDRCQKLGKKLSKLSALVQFCLCSITFVPLNQFYKWITASQRKKSVTHILHWWNLAQLYLT